VRERETFIQLLYFTRNNLVRLKGAAAMSMMDNSPSELLFLSLVLSFFFSSPGARPAAPIC